MNFLFALNEIDSPLTRKDLLRDGLMQAVVLTRNDLNRLGGLNFIHSSGERMPIKPEDVPEGDVLILYPWEVGDAPATM